MKIAINNIKIIIETNNLMFSIPAGFILKVYVELKLRVIKNMEWFAAIIKNVLNNSLVNASLSYTFFDIVEQ